MSDKDNKEVKKYLTEIKELPSYEEGDGAEKKVEEERSQSTVEKVEPNQEVEKQTDIDSSDNPKGTNDTEIVKIEDPDSQKDVLDDILKTKTDDTRRIFGVPFKTRDILLNVINLLTLILLIVILTRIDDKAVELKEVKNENVRLSENYNYDMEQVDEDMSKAKALEELFTTESGVIDFVSDVENLQRSGAIQRVSFSSPDPVQDKSGSFGRPIIIRLRGTWQQIDETIRDIHNLPYLFRPVRIEIHQLGQEEGQDTARVEVDYGGLLYIRRPENEENQ